MGDYWSKMIDYDDWMVHPAVFAELDLWWGPHTVDRFASGFNWSCMYTKYTLYKTLFYVTQNIIMWLHSIAQAL